MIIHLDPGDLPASWYNVVPDLLELALPPPMSSSGYPLGNNDLSSVATSSIIKQELEREKKDISIPGPVLDLYSEWRPTPMYRAERWEKILDTPARIYYKYEGNSASGSHQMNTALAQAYYASQEKPVKRIVTATGDGDWGISLAIACNYFNIRCTVFMVRSGYDEKESGRFMMEVLGAEVIPSPSERTLAGKKKLAQAPDSPGSLGIALSEAFEDASTRDDTKFSWGTVMNHVLLHQTIIGQEARLQLKNAGVKPDIIICAVGGGSGFGGLVFPLYRNRSAGTRIIAVETAACPSLSKGRYAYDYGDAEGLSPLLKMYTLGHSFVPPGISAGGMRYHGISPLISALYREKRIEARSYSQKRAFEAAVMFARAEGLIPSPESSYAVAAVIDEANACKEKKERKNILFLLDASGNLEFTTYREYIRDGVEEHPFHEDQVAAALEKLPEVRQS
ncbi:MAG: TrpB-like pyridoxal phosphate-dependent enzyme [Dehalococcoidia bacterium]|nr:TrpB-like pyridoxal phosphate-dependent enzyme [Dehalococcoidia bacterium]MDZ4247496.1 TrpB-like pyridoxal phosphate-dependent enzyme [Dehalococcoidia bacterium]